MSCPMPPSDRQRLPKASMETQHRTILSRKARTYEEQGKHVKEHKARREQQKLRLSRTTAPQNNLQDVHLRMLLMYGLHSRACRRGKILRHCQTYPLRPTRILRLMLSSKTKLSPPPRHILHARLRLSRLSQPIILVKPNGLNPGKAPLGSRSRSRPRHERLESTIRLWHHHENNNHQGSQPQCVASTR